MEPLSLYPIIPIILLALLAMKVMGWLLKIKPAEGHFAAIDGLRGYLAFFVFLHHSSIWYFFLHGKGWAFTNSNVYNHFGPTSVAVFFMITAFLFFSKLLEARDRGMDWLKLYVSRVLRIMPLYLFAICILVIIVASITHFKLLEPGYVFALEIIQWLVFIEADLNRLGFTRLIVAGVVWSLAFEWLFYCTLPLMGFLLRIKVTPATFVCYIIGSIFFAIVILQFYSYEVIGRICPFFSGMLAAMLARNSKVRELMITSAASVCIVLFLVLIVAFYPSVYEPVSLLLLTAAFVGIACGNDLFGILTHSWSKTLGQISYSIYLLHGMILFVVFKWVVGFRAAGLLSPVEHWLIISLCAIAVVIISSCTFHWIEQPALRSSSTLTARLKKKSIGRKNPTLGKA